MTEYLRTLARANATSTAQRWRSAAELWDQVVTQNPVNGNHWYRLAEARFAAGNHADALPAYRKALDLGVWKRDVGFVLPADLHLRIARCHALLGDPEAARTALTAAVDRGLRQLDEVWDDDPLVSLRGEDWFIERFRPSDAGGLGRDTGWRADLRHVASEIARRSPHFATRVDQGPFDAAVNQLHEDIPRLTDAQIYVELMKLLRLLGDGHAGIYPPDDDVALRRALPVQCYEFTEGLFITATAPEHRQLLGAQVLRFDGHPVAEVAAALEPLVARDNEHWLSLRVPQLMRRSAVMHAVGMAADAEKAVLGVRLADGSASEVVVPADTVETQLVSERPCPPSWLFLPEQLPGELPLYLRNAGAMYWFEYLAAERLAYVQFNGVGDDQAEPVRRFWERLFDVIDRQGAERLVVDLRFNGGGNTFLTLPLLHRIVGHQRINQRGRLFVIIGRNTFSAAQNFATMLDCHTNAVFVGEPTGSSPNFVGETVPFGLPYSGLRGNVSDLYWQTSWPLDHRSWIAPELYAPPTFAAFAANRDVAIEAVLDCREHLPGWSGAVW